MDKITLPYRKFFSAVVFALCSASAFAQLLTLPATPLYIGGANVRPLVMLSLTKDQELYKRLVTIVLVEPVRDLPTDAGVSEFIDLQGCEPAEAFVDVCDRDAALPRPTTASTVAG